MRKALGTRFLQQEPRGAPRSFRPGKSGEAAVEPRPDFPAQRRLPRAQRPDRADRVSAAPRRRSCPGRRCRGSREKKQAPPELLAEVFELNMQLEEMRMNAKMGEDDPQLRSDLEAARAQFEVAARNDGSSAPGRMGQMGSRAGRERQRSKTSGSRRHGCPARQAALRAQPGARCPRSAGSRTRASSLNWKRWLQAKIIC